MWYDLGLVHQPKWMTATFNRHFFKQEKYKNGFVLQNRIVIFGGWEKRTLVLQLQKESEMLKIVRRD